MMSRTLNTDSDADHPRWWHGNDPVATAFFNSLSVTFPQGETFFIDSVRRYLDAAPPALQQQISIFIQQEATHTREHVAFNRLIKRAGYDTAAMDAYTRKRLEVARRRPFIAQLAATIALEHFTAILAHTLLMEATPLPGAPRAIRQLWQWHAIEEIEHKSVCYDTYVLATRNVNSVLRWGIRCQVMLIVSFQFWQSTLRYMADFFRQDGINTPRTWWRTCKFLMVTPGMGRKIALPWLRYFLPGFHPWLQDDRHLIAAVERELSFAHPADL